MADLIYMAKSKWRELLDTIRTKGGTSAPMTADQAIAAVEAIPTGITPTGTKQITENGTFDVTQFSSAEVNVPTGGGGVNIETADVTFDNVRTADFNLQLSSDAYNADNLIITSAVIQSGKYVDGVLYMDSTPVIYPTNDGVDYVNLWCKLNTSAAFNGKLYNSSSDSYSDVTNAFPQFKAGQSYRFNSTQNGGATSRAGCIRYLPNNQVMLNGTVRSVMCQRGYYYKHHFKLYYWND